MSKPNPAHALLRKVLDRRDISVAFRAEIESFLGNRYNLGDRIVIGVQSINRCGDPKELPGFTVVTRKSSYEHDGETRTFTYDDVTFPEAGSDRLYDGWGDGIVVPICGRKWRGMYFGGGHDGYDDFPTASGSQVVFERVADDADETEFTPWDPAAALLKHHQEAVDRAKDQLAKYEAAIARFRAGENDYTEETYEAACESWYASYDAHRNDPSVEVKPYPVFHCFSEDQATNLLSEDIPEAQRDLAKAEKDLAENEGRMRPRSTSRSSASPSSSRTSGPPPTRVGPA